MRARIVKPRKVSAINLQRVALHRRAIEEVPEVKKRFRPLASQSREESQYSSESSSRYCPSESSSGDSGLSGMVAAFCVFEMLSN